jgi:uridine phosphorylase
VDFGGGQLVEARDYVHRNFGGECKAGDVAPYVLLADNKASVRAFAEQWNEVSEKADHYEYLVLTGNFEGQAVSACSTGIGATSASTAIEELANLGAQTLLSVGVTTPLMDELVVGEWVVATGAVRWDGTSQDYVRPEYPAMAHFEMVMAGIRALENLGQPYQVGVVGSLASRGPAQGEGQRRFLARNQQRKLEGLYDAGVLGECGEAATLFVQSSIYGLRAGVMHLNGWDRDNARWDQELGSKAVAGGLEAIKVLMEWDRSKADQGVEYIVPANDA